VNLDWQRLKALVIQSDDWGLCAWSPDEQALRVLADTPAFRTEFGVATAAPRSRARATCARSAPRCSSSARRRIPPVWQANTVNGGAGVRAAPAPGIRRARAAAGRPAEATPRWRRPGLWEAVAESCESGSGGRSSTVSTIFPEHRWLTALRRGEADARRAHEQGSPVCRAVQSSGEYDASEPRELRRAHLTQAVERFQARFGGRRPRSATGLSLGRHAGGGRRITRGRHVPGCRRAGGPPHPPTAPADADAPLAPHPAAVSTSRRASRSSRAP